MRHRHHYLHATTCFLLFLLSAAANAGDVNAGEYPWRIGVETGPVWQSRNDVQIPGDTGTRFSLADLAGSGPYPFVRFELTYELSNKHSLRFLLAPFEYTETGILDKNVVFAGQNYSAGQSTEASYKFNSYRATYRYRFHDSDDWQWYVGGTLKIRDADIRLKQGNVTSSDDNLGVVPLIHLYGEYSATDRWTLVIDLDGLASPQGRAIDVGLLARYDLDKQWYVAGGYRTLEGGADNDDLYTFGWFNYAVLSAGYRF